MLPRITMCSNGKNTVKSRVGVIHSCMFDMHSNVPCILHTPSMKHTSQSSGSSVMCGAARLHSSTPAAAQHRSVLLVKRNFMRNSSGK